jgi:hypothetical protein
LNKFPIVLADLEYSIYILDPVSPHLLERFASCFFHFFPVPTNSSFSSST